MSDIEWVEQVVKVTKLEPGDYVAIHVPPSVSLAEQENARALVERVWPGIHVLFLVEPARLSVLRPVDPEGERGAE